MASNMGLGQAISMAALRPMGALSEIELRKAEMQQRQREQDAARQRNGIGQAVGTAAGLAKGLYGMYQDREHQKSVNDAVGLRGAFANTPAGGQQYYTSLAKNYSPDLAQEVYLKNNLPNFQEPGGYLKSAGIISGNTSEVEVPSWLDQAADIFARLPSFG